MRKEHAILAVICLAIATITILYLVLSGLPPASEAGTLPLEGNQSDGTPPEQNGSYPQDEKQSAELLYHIGGCGIEEEKEYMPTRAPADIAIDVSEDMIVLAHNLTYVCCADIEISMETEGGTIVLTEKNIGEMCRCVCGYSVDATIGPLEPGGYNVQLWGVAFADMEPELLFEKDVTVGLG